MTCGGLTGSDGGRGVWARAFPLVSPQEKQGKAGVTSLGLASLNNFSGPWGLGALFKGLGLDSGKICAEEWWPLV